MGTTPSKALHKAAKSGDTEGIESALRSGAPLDAVEDGRTPLMTAAKSNKPEILSLLLAKGASDYRDSNQELALHQYVGTYCFVSMLTWAGTCTCLGALCWLCTACEEVSQKVPLALAAGMAFLHTLAHVLAHSPPFRSAARAGSVACAAVLINRGSGA